MDSGAGDQRPQIIRMWPPQNADNTLKISLTPQKSALAFAMLREDPNALIDYTQDQSGQRVLERKLTQEQLPSLVTAFRVNPKDCLGMARQALYKIRSDTNLTPEQKSERTARYFDAYLELMLELDHEAFPPQQDLTRVIQGIPDYIPDGYLDMGSENELDPQRRQGREMLLVDKRKILQQSRDLLLDLFRYQPEPGTTDQQFLESIKPFLVQRIAHFVGNTMRANTTGKPQPKGIVNLSEYMENEDIETVCRHHALYTQVLLQAMGITSRLIKSEFKEGDLIESHANNLVRVNGKWFLVDVSNTERINGVDKVFMKELPENHIDVSKTIYTWNLDAGEKPNRTYVTRTNSFFQIRPTL